jgi:hypothetical protein
VPRRFAIDRVEEMRGVLNFGRLYLPAIRTALAQKCQQVDEMGSVQARGLAGNGKRTVAGIVEHATCHVRGQRYHPGEGCLENQAVAAAQQRDKA